MALAIAAVLMSAGAGHACAALQPAPLAARCEAAVSAASQAASAAAPPLDLKSLETQLRQTKAIGVFGKLALKNQIDDLLERFRDFYTGLNETSLVNLRQAFDMLVMKALVLLQDGDPPLAGSLAASRESIWGILSDPAKFAKV